MTAAGGGLEAIQLVDDRFVDRAEDRLQTIQLRHAQLRLPVSWTSASPSAISRILATLHQTLGTSLSSVCRWRHVLHGLIGYPRHLRILSIQSIEG